MIPKSRLVLLALTLIVSLAACGGPQASPTPAAGGSATAVAKATATTAAAEAEATSVPVAPTQPEEGDLNLDSVSSGMEQLASYKSSLHMSFDGTNEDGQAVVKSLTMEERFIANPPTQQVTWISAEAVGDETPQPTSWSMISIGDVRYMITVDNAGAETCIMLTSDESEPPTSALSVDTWGSIREARYLGTDTVNGVRAKHYVWKEGALSTWGFTEGKAETWVAVDDGYVVKQVVKGTGKGLFMAEEGETGTTLWEWNVTDANQPFEIVAPAGCESAASDIPVMADATDKTTMGDMIVYTSPSSLADVAAFYKAAMPEAGWEASGDPMEMDTFSQLEFTKDGKKASLMLSRDEDSQATSVLVSIE